MPVFLFYRPQQATGFVEADVIRPGVERCETLLAAARAAGVSAGVLASGREAAEGYVEDGFGFVAVGSDSSFIAAAARVAAARPRPLTI